jgi:hypothetical protein
MSVKASYFKFVLMSLNYPELYLLSNLGRGGFIMFCFIVHTVYDARFFFLSCRFTRVLMTLSETP